MKGTVAVGSDAVAVVVGRGTTELIGGTTLEETITDESTELAADETALGRMEDDAAGAELAYRAKRIAQRQEERPIIVTYEEN